MSQLVGSNCVICQRRIGSVLDASICAECFCPVHHFCSGSRKTPEGGCAVCGAGPDDIAREQNSWAAASPSEPPTSRTVSSGASTANASMMMWSMSLGILLIGGLSFWMYAHQSVYGTTAEHDLVLVEGVPHSINEITVKHRRGKTEIVQFSVGEHRTEWSSGDPSYAGVQAAIRSGKTIRMWVSTQQETLVRNQGGLVPLYKMNVGQRSILTYEAVVSSRTEGSNAVLMVGIVAFAIGLVTLAYCVGKRTGHA